MAAQARKGSKAQGSGRPSLTELRRELKEFKPSGPTAARKAEQAMDSDLLDLRRTTAERLQPLLVKGMDAREAKGILAEYNSKRGQILERGRTALDVARAAAAKRAAALAGRRRGMQIPAGPRLPLDPPSIVLKPILIWVSANAPTSTILTDSHADPIGLSWAQLFLDTASVPRGDVSYRLRFWYLWHNDRDYVEVINAKCDLVFDGSCVVEANTGFFDGGKASVSCTAWLNPLEWWGTKAVPDPYQPTRLKSIFGVYADAGGFWSAGSDKDGATLETEVHHLCYEGFNIPPREAAVIQVEVELWCKLDDGRITLDFASVQEYAHSIGCQLRVELLTAPGLVGPSPLGDPAIWG